MCSFCNQKTISGAVNAPTPESVKTELGLALKELKGSFNDTEIAYFGGSFTAIDKMLMISFLQVAKEFVDKYSLKGIRISTRPDAIDDEILNILKEYGVTSIELGCQSMDDEVLLKNNRGHTSEDIKKAAKLIKQYGFELGVQMMVGLYGDSKDTVIYTANELIKLKPDTVRVYPTVILKGTKLHELYLAKKYIPFSIQTATDICAQVLYLFYKNNIRIIKFGLHSSRDVEENMAGGIYHPAFKELCEGKIYFDLALEALKQKGIKKADIAVNDKAVSKMTGQKKINIKKLKESGYDIRVVPDENIPVYQVKII